MSFKNQSVFSSVFTNTTFTITEEMQISEVSIEVVSGTATLLGGLQIPGLVNIPVSLDYNQPVVLKANKGFTLSDITIDSTAGGVFEIIGIYGYNDALDPAAVAYFAATGITGIREQQAINDLITSLRNNGLWSKMKAVYPFVTDNRNLLSYTEDFSNAYWSKDAGVTVSPNTTTAPNGTSTADTITLPVDATSAIYKQPSVTALTTYTVSFYIKATSGQVGNTVCFRTNPGSTINMITLTNDWVRYSVVVTPTSGSWSLEWGRKNSATATSFYLWGAQLELGSPESTYQAITTTPQAYISNQFKYNLVNPVDSDAAFRLVFNGGWTHSSNGATPNGTNGYADTKLVPSSVLTNNNYHLSHYSRTQNSATSSIDIGADWGTSNSLLALDQYFAGISAKAFPAGGYPSYTVTSPSTDTLGYMIGSRTSSTSAKMYMDGVYLAQNTTTNAGTLPPGSLYLGAIHTLIGVGVCDYSNKQNAFTSIGDGLTDTEAANLYTAVQNYQTSLSRQV